MNGNDLDQEGELRAPGLLRAAGWGLGPSSRTLHAPAAPPAVQAVLVLSQSQVSKATPHVPILVIVPEVCELTVRHVYSCVCCVNI